MRFLLITLLACFLFPVQAAAYDYSAVTSAPEIIKALDLLKNHNKATEKTFNTIFGDNLTQKPITIRFYDLSQMNFTYRKYDALTCIHKKSGRLFIFINTVHKGAPAEAIASLLSHEVIHQDAQSSYQEEVAAWTAEATTWKSFKEAYPELNKDSLNKYPLVERLNTLEKMYVKANYTTALISKEVYANAGYKGLPEYSPGFGI